LIDINSGPILTEMTVQTVRFGIKTSEPQLLAAQIPQAD
jgi:hypothetical protein